MRGEWGEWGEWGDGEMGDLGWEMAVTEGGGVVADVQPGSAGARLPARRQAVLPLLVLLLLLLLVRTFTLIVLLQVLPDALFTEE